MKLELEKFSNSCDKDLQTALNMSRYTENSDLLGKYIWNNEKITRQVLKLVLLKIFPYSAVFMV